MRNKIKIFIATLTYAILSTSTVLATYSLIPTPTPAPGSDEIAGWGSNILGYVQFIGWGIAIGMLLYVGIKYMMASANDKANLKSGTINWAIGALVIGMASTIFTMVVEIFSGMAAG